MALVLNINFFKKRSLSVSEQYLWSEAGSRIQHVLTWLFCVKQIIWWQKVNHLWSQVKKTAQSCHLHSHHGKERNHDMAWNSHRSPRTCAWADLIDLVHGRFFCTFIWWPMGKKCKTACWTNSAVKLDYAHWAFFIGIMLAGAEAKPCVSHVMNPFIKQQAMSIYKRRERTLKASMHRYKLIFSCLCFNGLKNMFYIPILVFHFCSCSYTRPKSICWHTISFSQELHTSAHESTRSERHIRKIHAHTV